MFRSSIQIVNANANLVLLYLAINLPFRGAWLAVHQYVITPNESVWDDRTTGLVTLGGSLVSAFIYSAAAAIVFSRFASRIDTPMWKHPGDWKAFERFFGFWLLLVVGLTGIGHFSEMLMNAGHDTPAETLQVVLIVLMILVIPVGAGVTFIGNTGWADIKSAAASLGRVFDRFLVAAFLGFVQLAMISPVVWEDGIPIPGRLIAIAVDGYCDCVIFSYLFLALCERRDAEDEDPFGDY